MIVWYNKTIMLIYLASPYNGTPEEIERRMNIVLKDIADLQLQGHFVLTPLLGHFTLKYNTIPTTDAYWYYYSEAVLKSCKFDKMRVLMLKGWDESRGALSEEVLYTILTGTASPLIDEYKSLFDNIGEIEVSDDALHEIASLASEKGLGARGLRSVLDEKLLPLLFDKSLSASKGKISISVRDITTH